MSFVKKIWKDRISQFPNRRTINDGYVTKQVTVGRDEGAVTEEGTPFDATEMNDLENRIYAAIEQGGGGGGSSGTYDYTELFNKPRINNHELNGNKSLGDLGIASNADELPIESGSATNTKDYIDSGLSGKQNTISDSGWLPLPLASGVSNYGDLVSNYRKIGNVVYYNIWVEKSGLVWGSQVATIPSGYRPIGESTSSGRYGNGICNFSVATNGSINFLATTNTSSSDSRMFASGCFAI